MKIKMIVTLSIITLLSACMSISSDKSVKLIELKDRISSPIEIKMDNISFDDEELMTIYQDNETSRNFRIPGGFF